MRVGDLADEGYSPRHGKKYFFLVQVDAESQFFYSLQSFSFNILSRLSDERAKWKIATMIEGRRLLIAVNVLAGLAIFFFGESLCYRRRVIALSGNFWSFSRL